jgi:2,4-dienoyl-CoA reductase-like NADH-dependent reductase (Old Yellow Enzyme family)
MTFAKPRPATQEDIDDIIKRFTYAAEYLYKAGYDGIELHGAHGYLLSQFLSKTTNKRTDKYGGSLENRARLTLEIAQSIRKKIPASTGFMLGIKINSKEFQEDGFSEDDATELCRLLEANSFDFAELSGGTYQSLAFHKRDSTQKREAFFLEFAEKIVKGLQGKTKTYVTGGLRSLDGMIKALQTVDGVGLARPVCQEPRIARDLLDGRITGAVEQRCDQDNFGLTNVIAGSQIRQIGKDQEPIDMSDQKNVDAFMEDMGVWGKKMAENASTGSMYGYVDIDSVKAEAYGTAHA